VPFIRRSLSFKPRPLWRFRVCSEDDCACLSGGWPTEPAVAESGCRPPGVARAAWETFVHGERLKISKMPARRSPATAVQATQPRGARIPFKDQGLRCTPKSGPVCRGAAETAVGRLAGRLMSGSPGNGGVVCLRLAVTSAGVCPVDHLRPNPQELRWPPSQIRGGTSAPIYDYRMKTEHLLGGRTGRIAVSRGLLVLAAG